MCLIEKDKLAAQTGHRCRAWEQKKGVGQAPSTIYNAHTHTLDTSPCQLGAKPFFTLNPKLAHISLMGACLVLLKSKNCLIRIAAHSVVCSTVSSSYCVNRQEVCGLFFYGIEFHPGNNRQKRSPTNPHKPKGKEKSDFRLGFKVRVKIKGSWLVSLTVLFIDMQLSKTVVITLEMHEWNQNTSHRIQDWVFNQNTDSVWLSIVTLCHSVHNDQNTVTKSMTVVVFHVVLWKHIIQFY